MSRMSAKGWDALAGDFDASVFDPSGTDEGGAFARAFRRVGAVDLAVDLGCGTGRLLPRLVRRAERVVGIDFAEALLEEARKRPGVAGSSRIALQCADLARPLRRPRGAGLVTCVNALLHPDPAKRQQMLRNARNVLAPGGWLLLVVPALESALWVNDRQLELNRRSGARPFADALGTAPAEARALLRGVVDQGGARTHHFLKESLTDFLETNGFETPTIDRVRYPWSAYFENPPTWFGRTGPWDWLALTRRR